MPEDSKTTGGPDESTDPRPDFEGGAGEARETDVQESDPNADSAAGLAGEMGVSSERVGELRGADEDGTYGAMETFQPPPQGTLPPEQSADPATGPEPHPDQPPLKDHGPRSGQ